MNNPGKIVKLIKFVGLAGTAISAIVGAALGIHTAFKTFKDPKAEAGYEEHTAAIEEVAKGVARNREELRFLYRALLTRVARESRTFHRSAPRVRSGTPAPAAPVVEPEVDKRLKELPEVPKQRIRKWGQLPARKGM